MIKVPQGVKFSIEGGKISVEGAKGKLSRTFPEKDLKLTAKDDSVEAFAPELMVMNTIEAHIKNMFIGVTEGYSKKMQILYAHFPITVEVKAPFIMIKNFQGEKKPRRAKIAGGTKVEVKGQEVFISGIDKENVGQTAANIRIATKIRKRDSRVFQDGIYTVSE
ncbi:MAG: 50S ribosomal protein L6 [Candidatus Micrarchaeota archaeon]